MLTVKGIAQELGVSESLVYDWVATGELPHFRLGKKSKRGAIRIADKDLESFLAKFRRGGASDPRPSPLPKRREFKHLDVRTRPYDSTARTDDRASRRGGNKPY